MELYLCRHGQTDWALSGRHTGYSDIALTQEGERQAQLLGKRLKQLQFDAVYSSPMQRALKTCSLAGLHPIVDLDLIEWNYGQYEGLKREEIEKKSPNWSLFEQGAPGGELPLEVEARADRFLHKVSRKKGKIAIFSHGHFSRILALRWLGLHAEFGRYFSLSVASLSLLGHEHKQPVVVFWNDTEHLTKID